MIWDTNGKPSAPALILQVMCIPKRFKSWKKLASNIQDDQSMSTIFKTNPLIL